MNKIIIEDEEIYNFYNTNPQIDIKKINRSFIDLIKCNFFNNVSLDVNLANEMNNNIKMMKDIISNNFREIRYEIKDNFNNMNNELVGKTCSIIDGLNFDDKVSFILKREIEYAFLKNENVLKDLMPSNKDLLYNHINNLCLDIKNESEMNKENTLNLRDYVYNYLNPVILNINSGVDYLNSRFMNSSKKGKVAEFVLLNVLMKMYINADIKDIGSTEDNSCDILMERVNKPKILFECKNYDNRVDTREVNKFKDDIKERGIAGIFLSMQSSIVHKDELDLEILGKNILIYVGNVQYDEKIIQFAVDMIDKMQPFLDKFNSSDEKHIKILRSSMVSINEEYISFLEQKSGINKCINSLEDTISDLKDKINRLKISKTANLMSSLFGSFINANEENKEQVCKYCGKIFKINKQLNGHYAKCKIKRQEDKKKEEDGDGDGDGDVEEVKEEEEEEIDKQEIEVKKVRKKRNSNLKGKKVIDENFQPLNIVEVFNKGEDDEDKGDDIEDKGEDIEDKNEIVVKEEVVVKKKNKFINYRNKKR